MKILFIHNYYRQAGGEDVAFENEAALLKEKGHDIHSIVFKNNPGDGIIKKLGSGIRALYNVNSEKKLKRAIKAFNPDIIHVHNMFFTASPSVLFTAFRLKMPVVVTLHNYRLICCNALLLRDNRICELCVNSKLPVYGVKYKCYRDSASESALVTAITGTHKLLGTWKKKVVTYIALTEFARSKFLHSSLEVSEEQIIVQPNFVNDQGTGSLQRENFFLYAGRVATEKGIENLLDAFSLMHDQRLVIAGDGPLKNELQVKYRQHTNIIFAGQMNRTELLDTMKRCKALIFPSIWYEMLPFVLLESFASGTPVLASDLPSIREIVQDGHNGICFNSKDTEDIKNKIYYFSKNSEANLAMYSNARQTYLQKYHPDRYYNSVMSIYMDAITSYKASR